MAEEIGALRAVLALESAAFDKGVASARRQLGAMDGSLQKTGGQVGQFGSRMRDIDRGSRSASGGLQNLGFQVQDFAVQVGAGTSASQALAQQLPQLLSGFGMLGIILGTASAVLIPLGAAILGLGTKASTLKDALDAVNTAIQGTSDLAKIAQGDLDGLQERYGALTPEVMRLAEAQRQVGLRELADSAKVLNENLTALYSGSAFFNVSRAEDLSNGLGLGTKAARELAGALEDLGQAESLDTQLSIVAQMRERFVEMVGPVGEMTAGQRDFYFSLVESEGKMRELETRINMVAASAEPLGGLLEVAQLATNGLAASASALAGYFSSADGAAAGLANTLVAAAKNAWALAQARVAAEQAQDQTNLAAAYGLNAFTRMRAPEVPVVAAVKGGGGGGGGAQKEANDLQSEAARIFAQTRTEAEKYAIEVEKLNGLLAAGGISQDTFNRAVDDLKDKAGEAGDAANQLQSSFQDAFTSFVTGASTAQEAVSSLLSSLASMLANKAFESLLGGGKGGGIFDTISSSLGFADGGAFSNGRVTAFARGGIVNSPTVFPMANGAGLMGEAGPEAIMPLTRVGGKLGVRTSGGGGTVVNIDARGAVEGTAAQIDARLRQAMPDILRQSVSANRAAGARGY
jgi:hypothetical protein